MKRKFLLYSMILFIFIFSLSLFTTNDYLKLQNNNNIQEVTTKENNQNQLSNKKIEENNVIPTNIENEIFTSNLTTTSTGATVHYELKDVSEPVETLTWNNFDDPATPKITIGTKKITNDETTNTNGLLTTYSYEGKITTDEVLAPERTYTDTQLWADSSDASIAGEYKSNKFDIETKPETKSITNFSKKLIYSFSAIILLLIIVIIILFWIVEKQYNKFVKK